MLNPDAYTIEHIQPRMNGHHAPTETRRRLGLTSSTAIMTMELPAIKYIVPGIISEGLTLLAGKGKIGKSWLVMGTAIAVATGGYAFGSIRCEQGDVLYLALEDNERRLQKRLRQLLPHGNAPERLFIDTMAPRLDNGLLDDLRAWIEGAQNPRMIVIDVLNRVRPPQGRSEGVYDYDVRCLSGLHALAGEFGVAILVIHHTRKAEAEDPFDCLSGSTGLPGTADATLVLARDSQGTTLYGRGRDIEEFEKAMTFDKTTGYWSTQGEAAEARRSVTRNKIMDVLSQAGGPLSPREVADLTGLSHDNSRKTLTRMSQSGQVDPIKGGKYALSSNPHVTPVTGVTGYDYRAARDGEDDNADLY